MAGDIYHDTNRISQREVKRVVLRVKKQPLLPDLSLDLTLAGSSASCRFLKPAKAPGPDKVHNQLQIYKEQKLTD